MVKILVRLSIVGFPFGDSIRWTLLLGLFNSCANDSNPIVAFTDSRNTTRATSGSPSKKAVTASFIKETAKLGSLVARLPNRVFVVTCKYHRLSPGLIFGH